MNTKKSIIREKSQESKVLEGEGYIADRKKQALVQEK